MFTRFIRFALLVLAASILVGCDPKTEVPETKSPQPPEIIAETPGPCLDFEDLSVGATYHVGDTIPTSGILLHVQEFTWSNGTSTASGEVRVENGGMAGVFGSELNVNNTNLVFEFGSPIQDFEIRFGEYGGNLNIDINGEFHNFEDFQDINGMIIGGVFVSVPAGGFGNDQGVLKLTGAIDYVTLGGQELWIDNRCTQPPGEQGCIDFEDLTLGDQYHVTDIFTTAGVEVYVRQFAWSNGTLTPDGYAEVQNGGLAGGSGNELLVNNVNLSFDFPNTIQEFKLLFGEYGGNLNIMINGILHNFEDFNEIDGMTLGGVNISIPVGGFGNDQGVLKLAGPIDTFTIGGQELWIDHICEPDLGACKPVDFENLTPMTTYKYKDLFSSVGAIIEVWDFTWGNGVVTKDGHALVDNNGQAGGSGNDINANNVNLYFDFGGLLSGLTLKYGDYGGNLNIQINGDFVNFDTMADIHMKTIGGVLVTVSPIGSQGLGSLQLAGEIELFAIGGQELWLDDVCPTYLEDPPPLRCSDFGHFPDDTTMPSVITIGGFTITALGPDAPFVNEIDTGVHGLQFSDAGIQIDLLAPAHTVTMTVGSYTSTPLIVTALDANGNQVDQVTVPGDNSVHPITLTGQNITRVTITGGGYEGILVEICYYPG